jgi:signal transduction histidine kinase
MLLRIPLFAIAVGCAITARAIALGAPADVRLRAVTAVLLAVGLVVAEGVAPQVLADLPALAPNVALLVMALVAGLTWRIPDRMQSWATEAAEVAMLVLVLSTAAFSDPGGLGTAAASALCIAWAVAGTIVGHRSPQASSHRAAGLVLVLGVVAAALSLHWLSPGVAGVAASVAVVGTLMLDRPPRVVDVGWRTLRAALGAGVMVATTWIIGLPLDGRALLPAFVGAFLVDALHRSQPAAKPAPVDLAEPLGAERQTLAVLGQLADPLGASTKHVMLSLEHVFPGGRIELLRNPDAPTAIQGPGARIDPSLLSEVCRHGVLHSDSLESLTRSAAAALHKLGPNVTLLPVTYEAQIYGALVVRGMERREGTLAQARRFADLLGHRLETQRLFTELQHKQRLATLGTFAAALVHDLRSPLATVRLDIQVLQRAMSQADQEGLADAIRALDRVLDELSGTLDYTRVLELDMGTHDMIALVAEMVASLRSQADRRGVQLERSTSLQPPARIRGDRSRLLRVLENLGRNALEVSPTGAMVAVAVDGADDGITVRVTDEGPGIDPTLGERIFEPFVTSKREGVGLGLAIVRKIIEAHQGRVTVESTPGSGTTMIVWLPRARG